MIENEPDYEFWTIFIIMTIVVTWIVLKNWIQ